MTEPNTGPAPTGMMTLESGLASLKAKMAASKATAKDQVTISLDDDGVELPPVEETEQVETEEPASEETESVSEDESEAAQEEILPETGKIILPDGSTITAEEARKGYLRQADFTKKTQAIAQEREAFVSERQVAIQQIGTLYQQLASLQVTEPNWQQRSREVSSEQYNQERADWETRKAVMSDAQQQIENDKAQRLRAERARTINVLGSGEFEPTWKDPKVLRNHLDNVLSPYWIERGLPEEMMDGVSHPAVFEILEESRRYRELQKAKPKAVLAVKGKPAPFKPGAKSTVTPQNENLRLAGEAFKKNPSIDNAAALERARAQARRR